MVITRLKNKFVRFLLDIKINGIYIHLENVYLVDTSQIRRFPNKGILGNGDLWRPYNEGIYVIHKDGTKGHF